jgi:hypothetical protein
MGALCSVLRGIIPITSALLLPGTLVRHLDCLTRILQVLALQFYDFPSGYHVWMCPEYAEDLNGPMHSDKERAER